MAMVVVYVLDLISENHPTSILNEPVTYSALQSFKSGNPAEI